MNKIALITTALLASVSPAFAFPEKEITLIIPWAAGGGTDAIGRMLANGLEQTLGQPVIVINRTGAAGVIAHNEIGTSTPDGYTIGLVTVDLVTYDWLGMADLNDESVTPIALINTDAATFTVGGESQWSSVEQALADIGAQPEGTFSLASVAGSGNHLAVASLLMAEGIDPNKLLTLPLPLTDGLMELASKGVDITPYSLPESKGMIDAGVAKPLGVFSAERIAGFDDVATITELTGHEIVGGTWRGIAGPKDLPDDIRDTLEQAIKQVWESDEFQTFMQSHSFGLTYLGHEDFGTFMSNQHDQFGTALEAVGLRVE